MSLTGRHILLALVASALIALGFANLTAGGPDPWITLGRIGAGLITPDFSDYTLLANAALLTVAFAFCGVAFGATFGLLLAPFYRLRRVRLPCITIRALHEIFWALLLLNVSGLSPLTGVLAIGLPYTGIFAKVFSEYLDEAEAQAEAALPHAHSTLIRLLWVRLPACLPQIGTYTLYRLECGLRSSAVLGFIGLPTLGFHLESFFKQAHYSQAAAALFIFMALILPLRRWVRWRLVPVFIAVSIWLLSRVPYPPMGQGAALQFLNDLIPSPLRTGADWGKWLDKVLIDQALPGAIDTLTLSQLALAGATLIAAIAFPMIVPRVATRIGAAIGHGVLVIFRSTPEYMLAFVLLQILGPSMLPAILALALHNGAIIAHLLGRHAQDLTIRPDAPRGLTFWGWELFPRLTANFWALCLYRWEIILRESAIMGLLGIGTLGFYVQTNLQQLRMDRALILLAVTVLLTLLIDTLSRTLRRHMQEGRDLRIEKTRAIDDASAAPTPQGVCR
ncbi:PhnE/PtxC family ABC transporter permease [Donghicola mangrovi]|uniref:PhnE/PtxC family ABC transporter permease n=1 Tax=Donghicola mangrovi TaxID=2729614 RepID=UPI0015A4FE4A|nr:ABC transporter permease [Donghicola mangrovi]